MHAAGSSTGLDLQHWFCENLNARQGGQGRKWWTGDESSLLLSQSTVFFFGTAEEAEPQSVTAEMGFYEGLGFHFLLG
ncbi:hypothetical protein MUK42_00799 [Musa troglodytarum]|uniref:Uncharacterized protein n=1 Tax=Musa troglodytarum TaxID=320322 RepID=A0A9E7KFH9_9LILI|nr:hypothetical protein MUK42_00799 [Musa troglodytarum]